MKDAEPRSPPLAAHPSAGSPPGVGSATHVCGEGGVGTRVYTVYKYPRGTGAGGVTDQRSRQPTERPQVGNPLEFSIPWGLAGGLIRSEDGPSAFGSDIPLPVKGSVFPEG